MKQTNFTEDTITAIASGIGGSVAVLRISGKEALTISQHIWIGKKNLVDYPLRSLQLGNLYAKDHTLIDRCLAVYMKAPFSYTGEDVVEFQCHGGSVVAKNILKVILESGARHAEPGEFSKRAFINGKIDLTQAEAVADLIAAQSDMAMHTANRQLQGNLGSRINQCYERLTEILGEIEVRMDFVDEDLDWSSDDSINIEITKAQELCAELLQFRNEGEILRNGIRLVIAGATNAGKSSLLNLILGIDRAIVTNVPGTTRDTLEEYAHIRGIPIKLIDTAGIREATDLVEKEGIARSYGSMKEADLILWVIDSSRTLDEQQIDLDNIDTKKIIAVVNKIDIANNEFDLGDISNVRISAVTGDGYTELLDCIEEKVWGHPHKEEPDVAINSRHAVLLDECAEQLAQAKQAIPNGEFELLAINISSAINALGKITGRTLQDDVMDYIFAKFCIGK